MTEDKIYKVAIIVNRSERSFVYAVQSNLTMEEAETLCEQTIMDAQNGLYIPVDDGYQPHAINPAYIIEISVER